MVQNFSILCQKAVLSFSAFAVISLLQYKRTYYIEIFLNGFLRGVYLRDKKETVSNNQRR